MKRKIYAIIIIILFSVLFMSLILVPPEKPQDEKLNRFKVNMVTELVVIGKVKLPSNVWYGEGLILKDTKTNIKYLYIWAGQASGGPSITRYWENSSD